MSVDLLVFAVFLEQSPQDSHTPHPQFLNRHASVGSSLALAGTRVTTLSIFMMKKKMRKRDGGGMGENRFEDGAIGVNRLFASSSITRSFARSRISRSCHPVRAADRKFLSQKV